MKVDNETIAISAIVLALLLYWANRKVKTDEEVKRDDDHRKLAIILPVSYTHLTLPTKRIV